MPGSPVSQAPAGEIPASPNQGEPDHKGDRQAAPPQRTVDKLVGKLGNAISESDLAELDRARAEFHVSGSMTGNNIGRDNNTTTIYNYRSYAGQGTATIRAYRLTAEDLSEPFVGIDMELATMTAAARDHRIVLVRGSAGIGKASALLHVFSELFPVGVPIIRLEPSTDLKAVSLDNLPENAVLVLPDLTAEDMRRLDDGFTFDHLGAELELRNMRLGITGQSDIPGPAAARMPVVDMRKRPDPREVFAVHLATLLMSRPSERVALLADPAVKGLLAELLDDGISMENVARLAKSLAEHADHPAKAAAVVRERSDRLAQEDCARWFRGLPGLRASCMAIALAVLNGLSRELISSAADELEELIAPTPDPGAVNASPKNPFLTGSDVSLSVLRAQTAVGSTSISTGDLPITTLAFVHPKYPVWVVRLVWQEYDAARPALVTWLKRLGAHETFGVRVRTATAVGMLAIDAFTFLCQRVIGPWALDDEAVVRYSAAISMAPPATNPNLRLPVTDLVDKWASDDNPLLQATAALVHGGEMGSPTRAHRYAGSPSSPRWRTTTSRWRLPGASATW